MWHIEVSWPPPQLIRFWLWSVVFPHFGAILTWNRSNLQLPGIFLRTHGRNGLQFSMLMYHDHLHNWLCFGHLLIFYAILTWNKWNLEFSGNSFTAHVRNGLNTAVVLLSLGAVENSALVQRLSMSRTRPAIPSALLLLCTFTIQTRLRAWLWTVHLHWYLCLWGLCTLVPLFHKSPRQCWTFRCVAGQGVLFACKWWCCPSMFWVQDCSTKLREQHCISCMPRSRSRHFLLKSGFHTMGWECTGRCMNGPSSAPIHLTAWPFNHPVQ